jgi:hypothetical protein
MDQLVRCWNTCLWKRWEMGPLQPITKKVFDGELEATGKNNSNNSILELLIIIQCWSSWSHNCMLQVASVQRCVEIGITDAILQVWMFMLQFMILQFMSFRFSGSRADDSYLWSVYSVARLRVSQPLWGGCRQNFHWDRIVRVHQW